MKPKETELTGSMAEVILSLGYSVRGEELPLQEEVVLMKTDKYVVGLYIETDSSLRIRVNDKQTGVYCNYKWQPEKLAEDRDRFSGRGEVHFSDGIYPDGIWLWGELSWGKPFVLFDEGNNLLCWSTDGDNQAHYLELRRS